MSPMVKNLLKFIFLIMLLSLACNIPQDQEGAETAQMPKKNVAQGEDPAAAPVESGEPAQPSAPPAQPTELATLDISCRWGKVSCLKCGMDYLIRNLIAFVFPDAPPSLENGQSKIHGA